MLILLYELFIILIGIIQILVIINSNFRNYIFNLDLSNMTSEEMPEPWWNWWIVLTLQNILCQPWEVPIVFLTHYMKVKILTAMCPGKTEFKKTFIKMSSAFMFRCNFLTLGFFVCSFEIYSPSIKGELSCLYFWDPVFCQNK